MGEIAKSQKDIEPERVVEFVKRYIGRPDAPTYEFNGVKYDPITITALIFKRMVQYADWQGYEVENVVLTCPSYFGIEERTALKQAATIAGLNVLDIINEPTAAVLSSFSLEELQTSKRILVYDLGENTFDLTLIISSFNDIAVRLDTIRTDGNDRLGGIDWDSRLLDIMSQKYAFETGIEESDMDNELRATIASHVERIKKHFLLASRLRTSSNMMATEPSLQFRVKSLKRIHRILFSKQWIMFTRFFRIPISHLMMSMLFCLSADPH